MLIILCYFSRLPNVTWTLLKQFFIYTEEFRIKVWKNRISTTFEKKMLLLDLFLKFNPREELKEGYFFMHFGVPLCEWKPKKDFIFLHVDHMKSKLLSWKRKSISMAGRLTFVKSVDLGAFTHAFFIYKWLRSILKYLNLCIRNFLWTRANFERKRLIMAWHVVCDSILGSRLGFRDLVFVGKNLQ